MFRRIFEILVAISMVTIAIIAVDSCGRSQDLLAGRETKIFIHYDIAPAVTPADIQRLTEQMKSPDWK